MALAEARLLRIFRQDRDTDSNLLVPEQVRMVSVRACEIEARKKSMLSGTLFHQLDQAVEGRDRRVAALSARPKQSFQELGAFIIDLR
jgi:hypothetical protein